MTDTPKDPAETPEPTAGNETAAQVPSLPDAPQLNASGRADEPTSETASAAESAPQPPAAETHHADSAVSHGWTAPSSAQPEQTPATQPEAPRPASAATAQNEAPQHQQPNAQQQPQHAPAPQQHHEQAGQQHTSAYPTADYGHGSFGPAAQQPYQQQQYAYAGGQPPMQPPHGGQSYATAPSQPNGEKAPRKRGAGLVIAALAVGALIGGASGAGVVGLVDATQNPSARPAASSGAQNITVNDSNDATVVTAVAAKASPSVVTISVTGSQSAGTGSGVVLTDDGYVLTNTHVVTLDGEIANPTIQVQDNDGKLYNAKIVGTDPIVDLAVIKLEGASGMTPAKFANSDKLNVGDTAVAIGAPLGLSGTVTDGIVSALNRSIQIASSAAPKQDQQSQGDDNNPLWNFDFPGQDQGQQQQQASSTISLPVIQTDAAINPGNSGGALLNSKGEVIGINVAIASASNSTSSDAQSGNIGVGFAIPANLAERVSQEIIKNGSATHGLLGATVKDASTSDKATTVGAQLVSVSSGGAAAKAGLKAGDVVTNFNGKPITDATDLTAQVRALAAGDSADLTYVRDGKPYTVSVTVGKLTD
jgi:putative serine protease PepD